MVILLRKFICILHLAMTILLTKFVVFTMLSTVLSKLLEPGLLNLVVLLLSRTLSLVPITLHFFFGLLVLVLLLSFFMLMT
jgi:hypothetical protein